MASTYWKGEHTKHRLQYHLVWIPKYRKRILRGEIAERLKSLLYECCQINSWWIDSISIQTDHVHVLIQVKPENSVAEIVQIMKGGSSRVLRKEFPEIKEFLWGDSFWNDGYFAETVGKVDESIVRRYIKEQQSKTSQIM